MDVNSTLECGTVVSSRVRLARNINGILFPSKLKGVRQRSPITSALDKALKAIDKDTSKLYGFRKLLTRELSDEIYDFWKESGYLHDCEPFDIDKEDALFISNDSKIACTTNSIDHIRISSIDQGLSLKECYEKCATLEAAIGKRINFAKIGDNFLVANVTELPLGVKMTVRVNLINTFRMAKIGEIKKYLNRKGFLILATYSEFSDDDYPAGCYFDISMGGKNQIPDCPKKSIQEMFDSFQEVCEYLDDYEKEQLDTVLMINTDTVKNSALRAYTIMKFSLLLTEREVLDILSDIRVGKMMKLFDGFTYEELYRLLPLTQDAHLHIISEQSAWSDVVDAIKNKLTASDKFRAQFIQRWLEDITLTEDQ